LTEQRPEPRANLEIPVRIFGLDAAGAAFSEATAASDISLHGIRILGFAAELKAGNVIGVSYESGKARCRVIWVIHTPLSQTSSAGLRLLEDQACPWEQILPVIARSQERRHMARVKTSLSVEARTDASGTPSWYETSDMSGRGCYLAATHPLRCGLTVHLSFWLDTLKITTEAVVRTSDPGVGMGLEFVNLPSSQKERIQTFLEGSAPHATQP
jgi:hypothetical protein